MKKKIQRKKNSQLFQNVLNWNSKLWIDSILGWAIDLKIFFSIFFIDLKCRLPFLRLKILTLKTFIKLSLWTPPIHQNAAFDDSIYQSTLSSTTVSRQLYRNLDKHKSKIKTKMQCKSKNKTTRTNVDKKWNLLKRNAKESYVAI